MRHLDAEIIVEPLRGGVRLRLVCATLLLSYLACYLVSTLRIASSKASRSFAMIVRPSGGLIASNSAMRAARPRS